MTNNTNMQPTAIRIFSADRSLRRSRRGGFVGEGGVGPASLAGGGIVPVLS